MYTILRDGTPVIDCDNLQTAVRMVQSLESNINRQVSHSPYTIVPSSSVPVDHTRANIGKSALYACA